MDWLIDPALSSVLGAWSIEGVEGLFSGRLSVSERGILLDLALLSPEDDRRVLALENAGFSVKGTTEPIGEGPRHGHQVTLLGCRRGATSYYATGHAAVQIRARHVVYGPEQYVNEVTTISIEFSGLAAWLGESIRAVVDHDDDRIVITQAGSSWKDFRVAGLGADVSVASVPSTHWGAGYARIEETTYLSFMATGRVPIDEFWTACIHPVLTLLSWAIGQKLTITRCGVSSIACRPAQDFTVVSDRGALVLEAPEPKAHEMLLTFEAMGEGRLPSILERWIILHRKAERFLSLLVEACTGNVFADVSAAYTFRSVEGLAHVLTPLVDGELDAVAEKFAAAIERVQQEYGVASCRSDRPVFWSKLKKYLARKRALFGDTSVLGGELLWADESTWTAGQYTPEWRKRYALAVHAAHVVAKAVLLEHLGLSEEEVQVRLQYDWAYGQIVEWGKQAGDTGV